MTSVAGHRATVQFGELDIAYDDRVLRPRPWTTAQSRWAAELLREAPPGPVLELCCGAGHIGLLAVLDSQHWLVAVDADPVACDYARYNAATAGLADRVEIRNLPLAEALSPDERFAVIIADPPWVPSARTADFPDDPVFAIDGGTDGLELARRCLDVARVHLVPDGTLLLQLGSFDQVDQLCRSIPDGVFVLDETRRPDPTGVVVCLRRPADAAA